MKIAIVGLTCLTLIIAVLWFTIGGPALAIAAGILAIVAVVFSAFAAGSWWSARLMREGAQIALAAQVSDDKRDITQINALAGLVKETLKIRGELTGGGSTGAQYPALPFSTGGVIDGDFRIANLPDESEVQ